MTISLIYYRFIVRFTMGLEFLFIQFLLQLFLVQMSSLSISSSATYASTFSNHIYLSIDIITVYFKNVFVVVMDVVFSKARSGIPSELLYADDLVLMALIMEPLCGKYKVMVGSSDGNCKLWKVTLWPSVGKECRQTLLSAQYVQGGFTSGFTSGTWQSVVGSRWFQV